MSKGQSKNGVRLTINNSSPYSTMIITDIDVEPGIDTVILDIGNSLPPYVSGEGTVKKSQQAVHGCEDPYLWRTGYKC